MTKQKQIQMSPSSETNFQSVSIYANNEMQLQSTFHFTFQLRGPEMEKNTIKTVSGKMAHVLWLAYEMLSITGKITLRALYLCVKQQQRQSATVLSTMSFFSEVEKDWTSLQSLRARKLK